MRDDDLDAARGIFNALVLSLVLWAALLLILAGGAR
jgi:hypothetical protein